MIVTPSDLEQAKLMLAFLHQYAQVPPALETRLIGWVVGNELKIVVGINGFFGKVCQMHVAFHPEFHFSPREMLYWVFRYVFIVNQREIVIGIVNSRNQRALRYDRHLGFRELFRLPKMHDDDGDMVILGMTADQCRFLKWHGGKHGSDSARRDDAGNHAERQNLH